MSWMDLLKLVAAVASGLIVVIPLIIYIANFVKSSIREKNWPEVLAKVIDLMEVAESNFETGADRKKWVMSMLEACADSFDYDIDYNVISEMIDRLCAMCDAINASITDHKNIVD